MRTPTAEELRAERYRSDAVKRRRAIADRKRKLKGNAGARSDLQRKWNPLTCDTSYVENRK